MPRLGVVTLKSFEGDFEHFSSEGDFEGHTRVGFEVANLEDTLSYFEKEGIKVSNIVTLPTGQVSFDIHAFDGARITAIHNKAFEGHFSEAQITGFSDVNVRIGVNDISNAVAWYQENLGFKLVEQNDNYALLQVEDAYDWIQLSQVIYDNILLEKLEEITYEKANPSVRNYFDVRPELFNETYNQLKENGLEPSEVAGNPNNGWGGFHFFDLDGKRINVWSYTG